MATASLNPGGPVGPIIPTFAPPPPLSTFSTGTPTSRSALPGSILSISHTTTEDTFTFTFTLTSSDTSLTTIPTTPTSTPTPTDSQPASSGTSTADSSSAIGTPAPSSTAGMSSMTSDSSSAGSQPLSTSSPSPTAILPVSAASHSSHAGAIAGGVVGGVVFIILALCALLFCLRRRNRQKSQNDALPWSSSGALGRRRAEVRISSSSGLASAAAGDRTSGYGFATQMRNTAFNDPKAMYGDLPRRSSATAIGRGAPAPSASSHTHDDFSDDEEKTSTLAHHDSGSARGKSLDLAEPALPHLPMTPQATYTRDRPARATAQPVSRSPSGASTLDPFTTPAERRASGTHRRPTQRKAVPKYDAAEFTAAPSEWRDSQVDAGRPLSGASLGSPVPALNHKTSYGDMRPVHYLIPDMPPPQKE